MYDKKQKQKQKQKNNLTFILFQLLYNSLNRPGIINRKQNENDKRHYEKCPLII